MKYLKRRFGKESRSIKAIQYTGQPRDEIEAFVGEPLEWKLLDPPLPVIRNYVYKKTALINDYIVEGTTGWYVCSPADFEADYTIAETPEFEKLRHEALKALQCLYVAVPEDVARDVNAKVTAYIHALESDA